MVFQTFLIVSLACIAFPAAPLFVAGIALLVLHKSMTLLIQVLELAQKNLYVMAGVAIFLPSVYLMSRVLVSLVKRKLDQRKWAQKSKPIPIKETFYGEAGTIACDFATNQVYLPVYHGGLEIRVPLTLEMIGGLNATLPAKAKPAQEMTLSNSSYHDAKSLPKGVVLIMDGDAVKGMGSRISVGRRSLLFTAKHVLMGCVGEISLSNGKTRIPIERKDIQAVPVEGCDLAIVELPLGIWSTLGISTLKSQSTAVGGVVQLFGEVSGRLAFSSGQVTKVNGRYGTHGSSTLPGWSGTPLLKEGNVAGVHVGTDGKLNEFVRTHEIISVLTKLQEESPVGSYGGKAISFDELVNNYDDYEMVKVSDVDIAFTRHNYAVRQKDIEAKFKTKPWWQIALEEEEATERMNEAAASNVEDVDSKTGHLNLVSPPCAGLLSAHCVPQEGTISNKDVSQKGKVCLSANAEQQPLPLKEPAKETRVSSKKHKESSKSSKSGGGQKSVPQLKEPVSLTKPLVSSHPSDLQTGKKQSRKSKAYTPPHKRVPLVANGASTSSKGKSSLSVRTQ